MTDGLRQRSSSARKLDDCRAAKAGALSANFWANTHRDLAIPAPDAQGAHVAAGLLDQSARQQLALSVVRSFPMIVQVKTTGSMQSVTIPGNRPKLI